MQGYVNIIEASVLTGKHKDTIRRLIKNNKQSKYIVKGRKGQYLLDKTWLINQYDITPVNSSHIEASQSTFDSVDDIQATGAEQGLYDLLAKQLSAKDAQIAELQKLLHEKESNTTKLQDQFQQLLSKQQMLVASTQKEPVTPKKDSNTSATVEATTVKVKKNKSVKPKKSTPKIKNVNPITEVKTKKRWWAR